MKKRVAITGVTGVIGMALLHACIREKYEVLAICHRGSDRNGQISTGPEIMVMETDLCEPDAVALPDDKPCETFYHLAWSGTYGADRDDLRMQVRNIEATLDAVRLAKRLGCRTFVGAGSQAEYGRTEETLRPDTPAFPESGYGMAKLCAGQMSRKACEQLGMHHVWVRLLSVYGPYDRAETMVSASLRQMLRGEETTFTPGGQQWDFLYGADAADALFRIGLCPVHGRVYCLGSGQARPLREYILKMKELTGCQAPVRFGAIPYGSHQVMHLCADIRELTADTGFIPATDFETGIRETIQWMRRKELENTERM
ncbi:GDP-6-deoxy-D-mannose reductase [Eubacterium plexicaudatum ASF492]|uniref:NAD-dependent epimerase/dehydratase domain-containing protein n=1 Tax=Eubacterium plexicaudatum ASF492 TaxID=1235802 RepID=N2AMQ0_9FIRM|nr:GDP-6-deoxy-D-mannose reductase [Eubacterium plexicaudatum ASF492]